MIFYLAFYEKSLPFFSNHTKFFTSGSLYKARWWWWGGDPDFYFYSCAIRAFGEQAKYFHANLYQVTKKS